MKTFVVNNKYDGKKLHTFLSSQLESLNSSTFYKLLRKKDIKINGKRIHENVVVHTNDQIAIYLPTSIPTNIQTSISTIYEDSFILMVHKPAGIEVTGEDSLTSLLQKNYAYIAPCHRLDRNTRRNHSICQNIRSFRNSPSKISRS